jgi:predicted secreted protein
MSAVNGTTIIYTHAGTPLALMTNTTLNINQDLPDATTKDSAGWADHISGLRDWSIDVEGLASFVGTTGNADILASMITARASVAVKFAPTTATQIRFSGTVNLASLSIGAQMEAAATVSGSLTGKGTLLKGTVS